MGSLLPGMTNSYPRFQNVFAGKLADRQKGWYVKVST